RFADEPIVAGGKVDVAPFGRFVLDATVDGLDLADLAARATPPIPISRGALALGMHASGTLTDLNEVAVDVDLRRLDGTVESTTLRLKNRARLQYSDRQLEIRDAAMQLGETTLNVNGRMGSAS